jgi:hypothetical protein
MAKITLPEHGDDVVVRGGTIPHDTEVGHARMQKKKESKRYVIDYTMRFYPSTNDILGRN